MLRNKTVIFLGSSVTYGSASGGIAVPELLEKKYGVNPVKEAVPGTTLSDRYENSYIKRMKSLDPGIKADAFVCQLSTNDASRGVAVGSVSEKTRCDDFDTFTTAGAIEYIIAYARKTWNCPVIFYTGTRFDSPVYAKTVETLLEIAEKWDIPVIDLWNSSINDISEAEYKRYMADPIHPTSAGYEEWWLPEFVKVMEFVTEGENDV